MFNHVTAPSPLDIEAAIIRDPLVVSPQTTVMAAMAVMGKQYGSQTLLANYRITVPSAKDTRMDFRERGRASCVMVVGNGGLVGVLTADDIVFLSAQSVCLEQLLVSEVVAKPALVLREVDELDVFDAIELLQQHHLCHLPVLGREEQVVGLVTYESLLHVLRPWEQSPKGEKTGELGMTVLEESALDCIQCLGKPERETQTDLPAYLSEDQSWDANWKSRVLPPKAGVLTQGQGGTQNLQDNLQDTEKRFQAIFEQATVGIIMASPDGRLTQVNQKLCEWLGYTPQELLGLNVVSLRHPDYQEQAAQHLARLLGGEVPPIRSEEVCRSKEGGNVWLKTSVNLIREQSGRPQYFLVLFEDVSAHKRALTELARSEQLFRATFEQAAVGIAQVSPQGDFIYVNQRFCDIVGYPLSELLQLSFEAITHPEYRMAGPAGMGMLFADNSYPYVTETRYRTKADTVVWVNMTVSVVRHPNGEPDYYIAVVEDISDRKHVEDALQTLIAGTAATTGEDFFPALVKHISAALNVSHVLVSELVGSRLQSLAYWGNNSHQKQFAFDLDSTPCEIVIAQGTYFCDRRVQERFPEDMDLVDMQAESYLGVALRDMQGRTIGNLCVLDGQPLQEPQWAAQILQVFAARATAELERQRANGLLEKLNQELETKVKDRTAKLREREQFLQTLLDTLPLSIFWKNRESVYLGGNRHFLQDVGLANVTDIVGKTDADLPWQGDEAAAWSRDDQAVLETATGRLSMIEHQVQTNGQSQWLETHKFPLHDFEGGVIGVLGAYQDVSARKQAELSLQRSNEELARATRLKDEFLANMSHELRTPLNAILGMTEGLQEQVFGEINRRQLKALQTIENSGSHLLELINDILDLSKIESGQIELDLVPTSVVLLCQSSLTFVKQQAHKKHIQLETKLPLNLPNILVDERRLRQVLINLLNNAVKFTPDGGAITLEVQLLPAAATALGGQSCLRIAITDTGIGIAPEHLNRLFQPFVQIDSALNRQYEGTGLGLALVKRIVELHGGQVAVSSEVGVGSCFTLELPQAVLSSQLSPQPEHLPEPSGELSPPEQQISPLILLAEDNEANIVTVSSYLMAKGYRMLLAKDGRQAIDLAQAENPNLILMDIQMPGMDGLEAMEHIRRIPQLATVPIVALTALAMKGDRERCIEAGANDYLSKPVKLKQLATTIQQLLASV